MSGRHYPRLRAKIKIIFSCSSKREEGWKPIRRDKEKFVGFGEFIIFVTKLEMKQISHIGTENYYSTKACILKMTNITVFWGSIFTQNKESPNPKTRKLCNSEFRLFFRRLRSERKKMIFDSIWLVNILFVFAVSDFFCTLLSVWMRLCSETTLYIQPIIVFWARMRILLFTVLQLYWSFSLIHYSSIYKDLNRVKYFFLYFGAPLSYRKNLE